ncbi:bis(5'-nucleosyl)-tetraphosphatase (symmetrical) YqeK [uncultured Clostridium sp.]|jgi:predicted HD superfamily hydrolase involved in NAD metabolism|uniref:bis(5'-nucleosyl)-tetraphosphatase (symmetrical) YqeK n=1 Tax=uncultured Clostridium sp. TaxID=59620 RepID=UPI0026127822|nr:bis(5'-nucleosyl)-tetraphosphatase (symmetrical) YqeK [uncultured Clostridium sp.]
MLEANLKVYLKKNLSEKRYRHTLGVCETAMSLAKKYGVDVEKAKIAALGHDLAKELVVERQKEILRKHNFEIGEIEEASPQILHGFVGSILLKKLFKVEDKEILSAIDFHSTGKREMSVLEKIIYIADYIEPNRVYDGVEELREITYKDLDSGVLKGLNNTIKIVVERDRVIHPLTFEARNYLVMEMMKK